MRCRRAAGSRRAAGAAAAAAAGCIRRGDLHDGLGGDLVSILAISEQPRTASGEIATVTRRALDDLRLVVTSLEDTGGDLEITLGMFRERIEPLLRARGVALDCRVGRLAQVDGLDPSVTLHVLRILQESVTNAIRHSGTPVVTVEAAASPDAAYGARIAVVDCGCGGAVERSQRSGLANARQRAALIGARLTLRSGAGGTAVLLDLPSEFRRPA